MGNRRPMILVLGILLVLGAALSGGSQAYGLSDVPGEEGSMEPSPAGFNGLDSAQTDIAAEQPAGLRLSAPFDLTKIIREARLAFGKDRKSDGYVGGNATVHARVTREGAITLVPFHFADGDSSLRSKDRMIHRGFIEGGSLRLETVSISTGGEESISSEGRAVLSSDGSVAIWREDVIEWLTSDEQAIEQSWTFEHQPLGQGDLFIRVQASGMEYAGETDTGLHFLDPATGLGFRYGKAYWIDSRGISVPVDASFESGVILLHVPYEILASSIYPVQLDPRVYPEFGLDNPVYGPASGYGGAVAFDGTNYMVVWQDGRNYAYTDYDIYGTRLSADGTVLDTGGIAVSASIEGQYSPAIAFDGTNYLVAWEDRRNYEANGYDIYAARLTPGGEVLDPDGFAVSIGPENKYSARIAFDGVNYMVVWTDIRSTPAFDVNVYGARVSSAGTVLDPAGIPVSDMDNTQDSPDIAFDGTSYMVLWEDGRNGYSDIYGARVSTNGNVLDPDGIPVCTQAYSQKDPAIGFDGTGYMAVWSDDRNTDTDPDVYGTRIDSDGTVLDPDGIAISIENEKQENPAIAFNGINYLVIWTDDRNGQLEYDIYGARVTPAGTVLDPAGIALSCADGAQTEPALAFGGANFLAVWDDARSGSRVIRGARIDAGGAVLDPDGISISIKANSQYFPAVAFDGTNYMVVWEDLRDSSPTGGSIYGTRVTPDGIVLDEAGILISSTVEISANISQPIFDVVAVAFGQTNYMVVWADARNDPESGTDIYGARVLPDGTVQDIDGIPVTTAPNEQYIPAVAFDGSNFLVVWSDNRNASVDDGEPDIYGARVSPGGTVLDQEGIEIATGADFQFAPALAFDGANYMVVWGVGNIYGSRVSPSGVVLDPDGIEIALGDGENILLLPSVAFDGTNYLAAWTRFQSGGQYGTYEINGARISPSGTILDPGGFLISPPLQGMMFSIYPAVVFEGSNFVVAWMANHNGSSNDTDIYATRIMPNGTVLDEDGFPISNTESPERDPALATDGNDHCLVAYSRFDQGPGYGAQRVRARILRGEECTSGEECPSGFCVDGVCCESECGGGDPGDCMACSISAGGSVDGTCGLVQAGWTCREAAHMCDAPEACTGSSFECPSDGPAPDGSACDDDLFCNGLDSCQAGTCTVHSGNPCHDNGIFCDGEEICIEQDDSCESSGDPCGEDEFCCEQGALCEIDGDRDGYTPVCGSDCDDADPDVHPGATEVCDGIDNDCDDLIDCEDPGCTCPTAVFDYDTDDLEVVFTDLSIAGSAPISAWHWTFGNGATSSAQNPVYLYSDEGTYHVCLTVTDQHACSATVCRDVKVSESTGCSLVSERGDPAESTFALVPFLLMLAWIHNRRGLDRKR